MRAEHRRLPFTIGTDKHASYPEAFAASVEEKILPSDCKLRRVKYLNNVIEQEHRAIRRRWRAMQCFRSFHTASADDRRHRSCAHDEERASQEIGRQGRGRACEVRRRAVRSRCCSESLPDSKSPGASTRLRVIAATLSGRWRPLYRLSPISFRSRCPLLRLRSSARGLQEGTL
jgi:DDE domain